MASRREARGRGSAGGDHGGQEHHDGAVGAHDRPDRVDSPAPDLAGPARTDPVQPGREVGLTEAVIDQLFRFGDANVDRGSSAATSTRPAASAALRMSSALPSTGVARTFISVYQSGTCHPSRRAVASTRSRISLRLALLYTHANTPPPGRVADELPESAGRFDEVIEHECSHTVIHGVVDHRQGADVRDGAWRSRPRPEGEHVEGQVDGQRMGSFRRQRGAAHPRSGPDVKDDAARFNGCGLRPYELAGDGPVDEGRAFRPAAAGAGVMVDAHAAGWGRSSRCLSTASATRASHQRSSSSSPNAFSQPNVTMMPTRQRSSWAANQPCDVDAVTLEGRPEPGDGRLLGFRQPGPVERQIPAEVPARGPGTRLGPVEQDGPTGGVAAQIPHLPVPMEEGDRGRSQRPGENGRVVLYGPGDVGQGR